MPTAGACWREPMPACARGGPTPGSGGSEKQTVSGSGPDPNTPAGGGGTRLALLSHLPRLRLGAGRDARGFAAVSRDAGAGAVAVAADFTAVLARTQAARAGTAGAA